MKLLLDHNLLLISNLINLLVYIKANSIFKLTLKIKADVTSTTTINRISKMNIISEYYYTSSCQGFLMQFAYGLKYIQTCGECKIK